MMTSTGNPVDQRFLEVCCCSVATGLAIASSVTRITDRLIPSPEIQVSTVKCLSLPHGQAGHTKQIEYGPSKFNSCHVRKHSLNFRPLHIQSHQFGRRGTISHFSKTSSTCALEICAAAFNSTCVVMETEPLTLRRLQTSTLTVSPYRGKSESSSLDDGGGRLPPGGGGGGGGRKYKYYRGEDGGLPGGWRGGNRHNWAVDLLFFAVRVFFGLFRDRKKEKRRIKEEEEEEERRKVIKQVEQVD